MIIPNHQDDQWDWQSGYQDAPNLIVFASPASRVSQLLGPDGQPLEVGYERPAVGFDLRKRT